MTDTGKVTKIQPFANLELKRAMADPEKGSWLSSELTLQASGKYRFTFNYDQRAYHGTDALTPPPSGPPYAPDDDDWREEFRRFPRTAQYLPAWARELIEAGPAVEAERSEVLDRALAVAVQVPPEYAALLGEPSWSSLWQRLDQTVREHMADDFNRNLLTEYREGGRGSDGFWQEIYGAITRRLAADADEQAPVGDLEAGLVAVGRLDAAAEPDERAAALQNILIALIESQVQQRLGMA